MKTERRQLDFMQINNKVKYIASVVNEKRGMLINTLLYYETYEVAADEIGRTLDLLNNLEENASYFKEEIGDVVVFLPSNQPLYAFFCFAVIPSFMSKTVYVKPPEVMKGFFWELLGVLESDLNFPNINVSRQNRSDFLTERSATVLDKETNKRISIVDAVIFTGTMQNANKIRSAFSSNVLFIANGAGHNPVIITETADIDKAIESCMRVQLYNQGQDCAAPNSILVHNNQISLFLAKLRKAVEDVKVGPYSDIDNIVGPISRPDSILQIQKILYDNRLWLDESTSGVIRTRELIIEPTIIVKPLKEGGNYIELFAPVFFVQKYEHDDDLVLYFENSHYKKNAMYVTVFGYSPYIENLVISPDFTFHDEHTIIRNTDLHAPGIERGTEPYGGYGKGASCISINRQIIPKPTLPQRDIYEYIVCGKSNQKNTINQRIPSMPTTPKEHWSNIFADDVLKAFPEKEVYVCAAGISPSGIVHFGNFRDVVTSFAVYRQLKDMNKKAKLIFSWDDYDRFRKVPAGLNESFEEYIGRALSDVPCPDGKFSSYAEKFEKEFEESMKELGIEMEYKYQTQEYKSGKYDDLIVRALNQREEIAKVLLSFMSDKAKINKSINPEEYTKNYYPLIVYSSFSGKDNTRVLNYDGDKSIMYKCFDSGKTETIDITQNRIVKLQWKVDWAMRWGFEGVVFEPGGHDHATPGGSYDVSSRIAKEIFQIQPPVFQEYSFVGIQGLGTKMSGSKGNAVSPADLLKIYEPYLLKWLYLHRRPKQAFNLAFDSAVYKEYEILDREIEKLQNKQLDSSAETALKFAGNFSKNPIPFRQAVSYGQIMQWNVEKMTSFLTRIGCDYDIDSVKVRLNKAKAWLEKYNPDQIIKVRDDINREYVSSMTNTSVENIREFRSVLANGISEIRKLEEIMYDIPKDPNLSQKENSPMQKAFFKDVYNLLISSDTGPRLSTFLWALDEKQVLKLLDI